MYTDSSFNPESQIVTDADSNAGRRLNPEQIDRLLDRLADDGEFRIRFHADPTAALAELGIAGIDPSQWICMQSRSMPTAEAFRVARQLVSNQLLASGSQMVFKIA